MKTLETIILEIDPFNIEEEKIKEAAKAICENKTVVFPTETVYGLGANGLSEQAVKKIFIAKGRPFDNPLILHIANIKSFLEYAYVSYSLLEKIEKLIPGPVTFVLKKKKIVPNIVTAGKDTVAIRMPAHPIASKLIEYSGVPIAAPSANISGKPSATLAEHVIQDMKDKVDYIIVGGKVEFGIESTVIDLTTGEKPVLLRPGPIPPQKIAEIFGDIEIPDFAYGHVEADYIKAPGMKYRHYSPDTPVVLIEHQVNEKMIYKVIEEYKKYSNPIILCLREHCNFYKENNMNCDIIGSEDNYYEFAIKLFEMLRKYDGQSEIIIVEGIEDKGIGIAVMNRLRKAAHKIIQ